MTETQTEMTVTKFVWEEGSRSALEPPFLRGKVGDWVAVRLAGEDNETYLGIMLGDLATSVGARVDKEGTCHLSFSMGNPAMYVPDLKRVVMGYESWWGIIDEPSKLKKITNQDIENVWYVKALKELVDAAQEELVETGAPEPTEAQRDEAGEEAGNPAEPQPRDTEGAGHTGEGTVG